MFGFARPVLTVEKLSVITSIAFSIRSMQSSSTSSASSTEALVVVIRDFNPPSRRLVFPFPSLLLLFLLPLERDATAVPL
jgi:hypothetical protein